MSKSKTSLYYVQCMINKGSKTKTSLFHCQYFLLVDLQGFCSVGVRNVIRYKVQQVLLQVEHKVVEKSEK